MVNIRLELIYMRRAYVALVIAMVSWGLGVTITDAALTTLTPADVLVAEVVAGTALVALLVLARAIFRRLSGQPHSALPSASWRTASVLGLLEPGIAYLLANIGLAKTSAAAGSMLISLESVFVVLLAWWFLHERPRRIEAIALTFGVAGAVCVSLAQSGGSSSVSGNLLMVLSSFAASLYFLASRARSVGVDPLSLVLKQGVWALTIAVPYAAWDWLRSGSGFPGATLNVWLLALGAGIAGFTIPFVSWSTAITRVRPAVAAVALNLIPVIGVASAAAFGRGAPSAAQLAGGALILFGLALLTRAELSEPEISGAAASQVAGNTSTSTYQDTSTLL